MSSPVSISDHLPSIMGPPLQHIDPGFRHAAHAAQFISFRRCHCHIHPDGIVAGTANCKTAAE
jgi:hypothetical protein